MTNLLDLGVTTLMIATVITFVAGFVKGAVGFAMPMIMISGLSTFLPASVALAALIVPTMVTNVWQAVRDGPGAAMRSAWKLKRYVATVLIMIALSAQLVTVVPPNVMLLLLGIPLTVLALAQLLGLQLRPNEKTRPYTEMGFALFAGFMGGIAGVWGPQTVMYLTAIETPKREQIRMQGVIFGLGSFVLMLAHIRSGVFNWGTGQLSAAMLVPALVGLMAGFAVQDRMDQKRFRKATLLVLVVAGLNLIRRGSMG
ncbi:MAG: sulfite exporter TauE/SafE family protein [Pseudomonadota bacterium]